MKHYTSLDYKHRENFIGLGLMSGTSLDGLDIAYCAFALDSGKWVAEIIEAKTVKYASSWIDQLAHASPLNVLEQKKLSEAFAHWMGDEVNAFLKENQLEIDFIASHGHTVFHDPSKGISLQIGDGQCLADVTGSLVVSDFRAENVAAGGQGAPLVPIGDLHLFSQYPYCLNLGGISNISIKSDQEISAFDIGPCNIGFNHFAKKQGLEYDDQGNLGKKGHVNTELLEALNNHPYYKKSAPKSLDASFFFKEIAPILDSFSMNELDVLRTFYTHVAAQIEKAVPDAKKQLLVTGGGAKNDFLIHLLRKEFHLNVLIPSEKEVEYKEALIFAFMGLLKLRGEVNCLASVTGSELNQSNGRISFPSTSI